MGQLIQEFNNLNPEYLKEIEELGKDILNNPTFVLTKSFKQHGDVSVYEHSIMVACKCLEYADKSKAKINRKELIKAALLHDYFLYDWHIKDKNRPWHASYHPNKAANNAIKEFNISTKVENAIRSHMWPLGGHKPNSKEAWILFWADKDSAFKETFKDGKFKW